MTTTQTEFGKGASHKPLPPILLCAIVFLAVACCGPRGAARPDAGRSAAAPVLSPGLGPAPPGKLAWGNPFGVFYAGKQGAAIAELGAAFRVMGNQSNWESSSGPRTYDEALLGGEGAEGIIVTLQFHTASRQRPGVESVGYHKYCLPEGKELAGALRFAQQAVERYDGDADFGCALGEGPDCYAVGDGQYPAAPAALMARPIHRWQVENEFFYQMLDCSEEESGAPMDVKKAASYLVNVAAVIRAADPEATLIFPAVTGFQAVLLDRGFIDAVDRGPTDCAFERHTRTQIEAHPAAYREQREAVARTRERLEYVLRNAGRAYDAIDFHTYDNDYRLAPAFMRWMSALGLGAHAVISTEMAGPFFMFPELGAPKPTVCAKGGRDDRGPARYSEALLAEYVIKKFVVGLACGVRRMHWATGEELFEPYVDNYQRLGLVEKNGRRKPAFYAYRLMVEKLLGHIGVEKLGGDAYAFRFDGKGPVVVGWEEGGSRTIDLSGVFRGGRAKVTRPVTELDPAGLPLRPAAETVAATAVELGDLPVFVEAATVGSFDPAK